MGWCSPATGAAWRLAVVTSQAEWGDVSSHVMLKEDFDSEGGEKRHGGGSATGFILININEK